MHTQFIVSAVVSAFVATASAAAFETPYVLSAAHADFLMQIEEAADAPGQIGPAARAAADLLGRHSEAEERVVLPLLGLAEAVAGGRPVTDPPQTLASLENLQAELPLLLDAEIEVVGAMVELFAAAEAEGRPEISRLAERIIWHEMGDAEVLYPAAVLVGQTAKARMADVDSAESQTDPGPLYGPIPMMGVGNPHAVGARP